MSDCFDHELDAYDSMEGHFEDDNIPRRRKLITCRKCGAQNLHWDQFNGLWRLFNINGIMHICENSPKLDNITENKDQHTQLLQAACDFVENVRRHNVAGQGEWHTATDASFRCLRKAVQVANKK